MVDTSALVLHSIPSDISEKDIRVYLDKRLSDITRKFSLPSSWPSKEDSTTLVAQSQGLFIFAATAANVIEDRHANDPEGQLATLMSTTYIASGGASPYSQLDKLYLQVLREAFPNLSRDRQPRERLKQILGTVVLLFDPLGPESLEALLDLNKRVVYLTLLSLHSIVIVPDTADGAVRLIHPSSHDFLIDVNRCNDDNFVVLASGWRSYHRRDCSSKDERK